MANMNMSLEDEFVERLKHFSRVNWSFELREELIKKDIFERYIKSKSLSSSEQAFCDANDWHPVDELPMKEEFIKQLEEASKRKSSGKAMTIEEFKKHWESL